MKAAQYSTPFRSLDGRSTWVTEIRTGMRRRVDVIGGQIFLRHRVGKAEVKRRKRQQQKERRVA